MEEEEQMVSNPKRVRLARICLVFRTATFMDCNSRRANFWSWRVNFICSSFCWGSKLKSSCQWVEWWNILHLLWLSRGPAFPGLSTESSLHYREQFINAKKKWNVILLEWGCIQKSCASGCTPFTRSQNKYPDFNVRPIRVAQPLGRWDVELENVNRCGDILMHFWKDEWFLCCYIWEFTPASHQKSNAKSNSHFIFISQFVWRAKGRVIY